MTLAQAENLSRKHANELETKMARKKVEAEVIENKDEKPARKTRAPKADAAAPAEKPAKAAKAPKAAKEDKAPAAKRGPRAAPEGYVGIAQLAEELGVTPAALRRKLRSNESIAKGEGFTWAWKDGSKELAAVKKALAS